MPEVLIANTYFLRRDPKQWKVMQPYPPLATLYAAAVLRANRYDVALRDMIFATGPSEIFPDIRKHSGGLFVIYDDGFNYLTKMCLVNMRAACFEMITFARSCGCTVLVSSSDATDHYREYLDKGADYILLGEGENTLLELANHLSGIQKRDDLHAIHGLAWKENGDYLQSAKRAVMHDLDALPLPAWDLADLARYRDTWMRRHGYFSLNIATTRGCPFKCNWCAKPIYGNRYNSRSPARVAEEMHMLVSNYGVHHFWFCDDIFGLKPKWIGEFRENTRRIFGAGGKELPYRFKIQCRVDLLLDENNIADLANSGCEEIWVGAESGSQKILDAMDKGTTVEQIRKATLLMKKHGIRPAFFLQFGYLGETKKDIKRTIALLLHLMPDDIGISVSYPLPGTKFFEKVKSDLQARSNWNDSDELLMMFRSTYSPAYYRQLHRYVHKRFRSAQGFQVLKELMHGGKRLNPTERKRMLALPWFWAMSLWMKFRLQYVIRN